MVLLKDHKSYLSKSGQGQLGLFICTVMLMVKQSTCIIPHLQEPFIKKNGCVIAKVAAAQPTLRWLKHFFPPQLFPKHI